MTARMDVASVRATHDADLARTARQASHMRRGFYLVVLIVAMAGQVTGAVEALHIPLLAAIPAVAALELGGVVVLANADVRRRLGERAVASRLLSAAIAAWAVAFNWLAHGNHLLGGFYAGMSALGYLVWLMHTENQRRDRLRAFGDLPPTTPAYELWAHWLRHPLLTMRAKSLAKANPGLGLYGSLDAARAEVSATRRNAAIAKVLHRKIRSAVDPTTADIAVEVYDLDQVAAHLAGTADYAGLTALIGADLVPARLAAPHTDATIEASEARRAEAEAVAWAEAAAQHADAEAARRTQLEAQLRAAHSHAATEAEQRADAEARAEMAGAVLDSAQRRAADAEQRAADAEAMADELRQALAGELTRERHERETAQAEHARLADEHAALSRELDEARQQLATARADLDAAKQPKPAAPAKRQPSAAERIAKAVARSPKATDAAIAARLDLSEATVRRHRRRQAVDSVSTASTPNPNLHAA
jgi:hypothetical protein